MVAMTIPVFHDLGEGVFCIDALYIAPELACCYLMRGADEYALIETGTSRSVGNIMSTLDALNVSPEQLRYVIPTHVHLDHAGGAGQLMRKFPEATLLIHPRGARHMIDPERLVASSEQVYGKTAFAKLYGKVLSVPECRVRSLEDGARIALGTRVLRVLHTRGHAEHHLCLYDEQSAGWFSGDMFGVSYPTLRFPEGSFVMPATTPTQFNPQLYQQSVRRLADSQPRQMYLTHYSTLPFVDTQADTLCRQLDAYAELVTAEGNPGSQDTVDAILEITAAELRRIVDQHRAEAAARSLTADAQLNAQGVLFLRQSRARARQEGWRGGSQAADELPS